MKNGFASLGSSAEATSFANVVPHLDHGADHDLRRKLAAQGACLTKPSPSFIEYANSSPPMMRIFAVTSS